MTAPTYIVADVAEFLGLQLARMDEYPLEHGQRPKIVEQCRVVFGRLTKRQQAKIREAKPEWAAITESPIDNG